MIYVSSRGERGYNGTLMRALAQKENAFTSYLVVFITETSVICRRSRVRQRKANQCVARQQEREPPPVSEATQPPTTNKPNDAAPRDKVSVTSTLQNKRPTLRYIFPDRALFMEDRNSENSCRIKHTEHTHTYIHTPHHKQHKVVCWLIGCQKPTIILSGSMASQLMLAAVFTRAVMMSRTFWLLTSSQFSPAQPSTPPPIASEGNSFASDRQSSTVPTLM